MADYKRWYDEDSVVAKCVTMLESLDAGLKHQTASFLLEEVINRPPFLDMLDDSIFELATGEEKRRRWYDYDEVVRILVELMRHSNADIRKQLAIKAISFVEDIIAEGEEEKRIEIEE